jgi:Na+/H+ antiporter NhaC
MRILALSLIVLFSSIFSLQANAQELGSGPSLIPGELEIEVASASETSFALLSIREKGEVQAVNDSFQVNINGADTVLTFYGGYAKYALAGDRIESLRVQYINENGSQIKQIGAHRIGTKVRWGSFADWTSILPPLIAILLALIFREVVISLLAGVVFGSFLLLGLKPGNFFASIGNSFEIFILGSLTDSGHASIILFSMMIGAMVAVISRNGGMHGVVDKLSRLASNARNSQLVTLLLGVAIFFDDYANTLVVGNTMRPVTDRFRISREKLAYLVDSTAAPVAAIAFITTWIGAELDYIDSALKVTNVPRSAYSVFLDSLQYSYYPILTLIFMLMLVWSKRDFGPMFQAEKRARLTGALFKPGTKKANSHEDLDALEPAKDTPRLWYNALIPVLMVIGGTMFGLWVTGFESLAENKAGYAAVWKGASFNARMDILFSTDFLSTLIGASDSYTALIWASSAGVISAVLLSLQTRTLAMQEAIDAVIDGFKTMLPAIIILVLAWSLASITEQLNTAEFLTGAFSDNLNPKLLPALTFIFAALISFSTGSSWSTMAILYPLVLPLAWTLGVAEGGAEMAYPIFFNVTATVLAGSVFGDHCSPISDTTILSSLATNCNHVDHVRTQLPYALTVGGMSILLGSGTAVMGVPIYINVPIAIILFAIIIRFFGKEVPAWNPSSEEEIVIDSAKQ